ncbi:MAG: hypothetical protein IBJ03_18700 [Gemmatimonadaceae bacterium]|nr:hypothetical protein [Gemmatimonadaceae bacterium]
MKRAQSVRHGLVSPYASQVPPKPAATMRVFSPPLILTFGLLGVALSTGCATTASDPRAAVREAMATESRIDATRFPARTVAVLPLPASANDSIGTLVGWAVSDMLVQDLAQTRRLRLLERQRIGAVIAELDLARSGRVDTATAPRAGRLLGARRVITGAVTRIDPASMGARARYRYTARVLDVATGAASAPVEVTFPLNDVLRAQARLSNQLVVALGLSTRDAARIGRDTTIAVSSDALIRYGRGVQALALGNTAVGVANLRDAQRLAPNFASAARAVREAEAPASPLDTDERRARLRDVAVSVAPLAPVRTAEAVDVTAARTVPQLTIGVVIILP